MKSYLGDGVYATVREGNVLVLTTENGISTTNTIILEPEVVIAMKEFIERYMV